MSDLSPEGRALLREARSEWEAGESERARVGRALAVRLGVAAGTVVGTTTAASASVAPGPLAAGAGGAVASGSALLTGAKWVGALLVVGAVGAGSLSVVVAKHDVASVGSAGRAAQASAAAATRAQIPAAEQLAIEAPQVTPVSPAESVSVSPLASVSPPSAGAAPPPTHVDSQPRAPRGLSAAPTLASPPPAEATVAAEARLLRAADEALRGGDAPRALALLQQHARTYPNSILAEERSVELVSTLCRLGRVSEARAEAARFLGAVPASVRRSCAGDGGGQTR
jgi:hypothetical protein